MGFTCSFLQPNWTGSVCIYIDFTKINKASAFARNRKVKELKRCDFFSVKRQVSSIFYEDFILQLPGCSSYVIINE